MTSRHAGLSVGIIIVAIALGGLGSADALTMQECSAKYKAAQAAGNKLKWNDFRKAECGTDASTTPATAAKPEPAPAPAPAKSGAATDAKAATKTPPAAPATAPAAAGSAVFPTAVSPKYSGESAGKARMHTCLDQYNANKDKNGNGGLTWIAKGGGYYSECNKRLKG